MLAESDLYEYQKAGAAWIMNKPKCGLFKEMGLGKTVTTLTAVNKLLYEELEIDNVLIVGPKRVIETVWTDEIKKWAHLSHLKTSRLIGNEKQRLLGLKKDCPIHLISRDNISWLCGLYGGSMLPYDMLIIDESSSFKNASSIRFKSLKRTIQSFLRVVLLTGTPTPNGLLDLWAQIFLLDGGERLGKFITQYRRNYFTTSPYSPYKYTLNPLLESTIQNKISDICLSMKTKDYLQLPDRIDNYVKVNFDAGLLKKYEDFREERVLELLETAKGDINNISAVNAAALSNKLLQFSNGAMYDEDKNVHILHDLKIKAVKDIVAEANGQPVLIAWSYKHDRDRLMLALKEYKPVELKGETEIKKWNEGKYLVMMMHPASGGHGLNLQYGGNTIIWFGQTWSLELYQQLNARLHRQGQKNICIVHHIICPQTIESRVIKTLGDKTNTQEKLMQAIKAIVKQYKN